MNHEGVVDFAETIGFARELAGVPTLDDRLSWTVRNPRHSGSPVIVKGTTSDLRFDLPRLASRLELTNISIYKMKSSGRMVLSVHGAGVNIHGYAWVCELAHVVSPMPTGLIGRTLTTAGIPRDPARAVERTLLLEQRARALAWCHAGGLRVVRTVRHVELGDLGRYRILDSLRGPAEPEGLGS